MRSEASAGFQARRPNPYKFAIARWWPSQLAELPTFDTPTKPPAGRWNVFPLTSAETGVPGSAGLEIEVERLFPHRHQEAHVPLLPGVLLCDLQLDGLIGLPERAKQRRDRLASLEVDRAMLDLQDDVVGELPVKVMKVVPRRARSIVFRVAPVHVVVVDEAPIEDDAAVRREGMAEDVGGVGMGPAVRRRPEPAF